MARVLIVSAELNSYFAALALGARGHRCALHGRAPETVEAVVFDEPATVRLEDSTALQRDGIDVLMLAAEGEDLSAGFAQLDVGVRPSLVVVVGGGATGIVDARVATSAAGIDPARVLVVSAFVFGGVDAQPVIVNSEKLGLLAAFLAEPDAATRALANEIVPTADVQSPMVVALSSLNALIHPAPMVLNAMSIERGEDRRFFVEGFGEATARVATGLDAERRALGAALGLDLPTFEQLLDRYYAAEGIRGDGLQEKINTFRAYQRAVVPHTFQHRYLTHEVRSSLAPWSVLMQRHGIDAPITSALLALGEVLSEQSLTDDAERVADALDALR